MCTHLLSDGLQLLMAGDADVSLADDQAHIEQQQPCHQQKPQPLARVPRGLLAHAGRPAEAARAVNS